MSPTPVLKDLYIRDLQQALGMLTSLAPTMERDSGNPLSMAQTILAAVAEREVMLVNDERRRLWKAMEAYWYGDMGPAAVKVRDIRHLFWPEAPVD